MAMGLFAERVNKVLKISHESQKASKSKAVKMIFRELWSYRESYILRMTNALKHVSSVTFPNTNQEQYAISKRLVDDVNVENESAEAEGDGWKFIK